MKVFQTVGLELYMKILELGKLTLFENIGAVTQLCYDKYCSEADL